MLWASRGRPGPPSLNSPRHATFRGGLLFHCDRLLFLCVSSSAKFEGPDAPIACRKLRQPSASTANRPEAFGLLSVAIGTKAHCPRDTGDHALRFLRWR